MRLGLSVCDPSLGTGGQTGPSVPHHPLPPSPPPRGGTIIIITETSLAAIHCVRTLCQGRGYTRSVPDGIVAATATTATFNQFSFALLGGCGDVVCNGTTERDVTWRRRCILGHVVIIIIISRCGDTAPSQLCKQAQAINEDATCNG